MPALVVPSGGKTAGGQVFGAAGVPGVGHQEGASLVQGKKITGLVGSVGGHEQLSGGWGADRDYACAAAGWPSPAEERVSADVLVI